jgi:HK97 family phage major capsid protein
MMHLRDRLLAGARPIAPERKDGENLGPEIKKAVEDLNKVFEDFKTKNDERLKQAEKRGEDVVTKAELEKLNKAIDDGIASVNKELKKRVDEIEAKANRLALGLGGGTRKQLTPEQEEYGTKFEAWFRKGEGAVRETELRDLERKAVAGTTDNDPSGGFTVRPEWDTAIDSVLKEVSPIRALATVRQISTSAFKNLVNQHGVSSGWVGERESRPQTLAPDLTEIEYPVMEIYAMPAASQTLLDDSAIDIAQWLTDEIDLEFAQQEGRAFIAGDGVKKPRGFLGGYPVVADTSYAWGKIGYVPTGAAGAYAATAPADALLDLIYALKPAYRANANFVTGRKAMAATRKLKDGQGNYLVDRSIVANAMVETIFGFPVKEAVDMPDIAANSLSLALGDFKRGYLVVDRIGIRVLRDPYTSKPFILFYTTKRVGGGVKNFEAIKLLKFAAS